MCHVLRGDDEHGHTAMGDLEIWGFKAPTNLGVAQRVLNGRLGQEEIEIGG